MPHHSPAKAKALKEQGLTVRGTQRIKFRALPPSQSRESTIALQVFNHDYAKETKAPPTFYAQNDMDVWESNLFKSRKHYTYASQLIKYLSYDTSE